MVFTQKLLE